MSPVSGICSFLWGVAFGSRTGASKVNPERVFKCIGHRFISLEISLMPQSIFGRIWQGVLAKETWSDKVIASPLFLARFGTAELCRVSLTCLRHNSSPFNMRMKAELGRSTRLTRLISRHGVFLLVW